MNDKKDLEALIEKFNQPPVSSEEQDRNVNSGDPPPFLQLPVSDEEAEMIIKSEKSTAWTDAQREAPVNPPSAMPGPELTGLELDPGRELTPEERKALPPWAEQLRPGRGVAIDGWNTRIVLIDPERAMVLLFVEGPTAEARKRVARVIKKASKKGTSRTPKGTKPGARRDQILKDECEI